jgi:Nucleotidyl transferase of unknown function (DUF2204)
MTTQLKTEDTSAERFYVAALKCLQKSGTPFMLGGAFSLQEYAGIHRDTKDLDIFCTAGDSHALLGVLSEAGYTTQMTDPNWLAKAFQGEYFVDLIFNSHNGLCPVDDIWLEHARDAAVLGLKVKLVPPEEVLWTKIYVQQRVRFDGADVNHILRQTGPKLDWERLLRRFEVHWELLLSAISNFQFVYPAERDHVPRWVIDELVRRMTALRDLPASEDRVCRGHYLDRAGYEIDLNEWGYRPT